MGTYTGVSVLSPHVLSPSVNLNFSCNCRAQPKKRLVPKDENTLVPDETSAIALWILKHLCCCLPSIDMVHQNKQAARMFEKSLIEEYSAATAELAIERSQIDFQSKKNSGEPLYEDEAALIKTKAYEVSVRNILKQLSFYNEMKKETPPKREIKRPPTPEEVDDIVLSIKVKKKDVQEEFKEDKIKSDLKNLSYKKAPSEEEISRIVQEVKSALAQKKARLVSSNAIRKAVANALKEQKFVVKTPKIDRDLRASLADKHNLEDLTTKEYDALLKLIEAKKQRAQNP